jgi:hypothetical protein
MVVYNRFRLGGESAFVSADRDDFPRLAGILESIVQGIKTGPAKYFFIPESA